MSSILISCESELEMDLSTQSDWKELKLGTGIQPMWKRRSWLASQEQNSTVLLQLASGRISCSRRTK
ncbi:hypothetical protein RchiOBHm_Chr4g0411661 [Rosa chinensis]|uniref:Uncharacterized protein n=1 Tax=Rosa chinensis TaxID=74649 RepID=A0A2P6QVN0_ROSCH|nr:hypothetical protein RchiOBHm_Chr4g0411661 [Rosa chinensis]